MDRMTDVMFTVGVLGMLFIDIQIKVGSRLGLFRPLLIYSPFIFCMVYPIYLEFLLRR